MASEQYALLFRLNPEHWPIWEERIPEEPEQWFRAGRTGDITTGIPAIILGTGNVGIVGTGETVSEVEYRSDPYAAESGPGFENRYASPENLVRVRIELDRVPVELVKSDPVVDRLRFRRQTTTWLSSFDYHALKRLMDTRTGYRS